MSKAQEATHTLEELGLTEYEARCFVALTRLSKGTAKQVSEVADVPRSRVYDTIDRLNKKGLVEVQRSEPREFKAVPVEMACRRLREDFDSRIDAAENALQQVEQPEAQEDEGMWVINQSEQVTDRIVTFLNEAEETIHYVSIDEDVFDQRIREHIADACDRGVEVVLEVPTEERRENLEQSLPEATILVATDLQTTQPVYNEWPAQLLLTDRTSIVATGIKERDLPDVFHETAVWTYGRDHGFAVWIRELLDNRLDPGHSTT